MTEAIRYPEEIKADAWRRQARRQLAEIDTLLGLVNDPPPVYVHRRPVLVYAAAGFALPAVGRILAGGRIIGFKVRTA